MIERSRTHRDPHFTQFRRGCIGDVEDLELVDSAGRCQNAGAHCLPDSRLLIPDSCYGRNVGVIICSEPVVGIGTGVAELTGWM